MNRNITSLLQMLVVLPMLAVAMMIGCSKGIENAPVDSAKARETLKAALESWKNGDASDALQKSTPPIYVIDPDWQSGMKLKSYEIVGDGEEKDAHLFCVVRLTIAGSNGQESKREVKFIISTAPNLTVSRKIF